MPGAGLLTLLDDIATVADDVLVLSRVAAKKTAALMGDDIAVNAEQVTGAPAKRELPVVWAVAKGSTVNKVVLIPAALGLGATAPWMITPLLMVGGTYLCYEGSEKVLHAIKHRKDKKHHTPEEAEAHLKHFDAATEKKKIRGAIKTDFILSAEIIAISLGATTGSPFLTQAATLAVIGFGSTIAIYSLVGGVVKADDIGLWLAQRDGNSLIDKAARSTGRGILWTAPKFMKGLGVLGTAAMFGVGGGIFTHNIPAAHHFVHDIAHHLHNLPAIGGVAEALFPTIAGAIAGVAVGVTSLPLIDKIVVPGLKKASKPFQALTKIFRKDKQIDKTFAPDIALKPTPVVAIVTPSPEKAATPEPKSALAEAVAAKTKSSTAPVTPPHKQDPNVPHPE